MMLLNLIITITLKVDHLLRLGGGTSGVAGLALLDGVFRVLFLFGEFSGVFAWRALLVCLFSNCLLSVFSPFPCFAPKYWKKRRGVSTYIIHIPVPSIFVVFKEWTDFWKLFLSWLIWIKNIIKTWIRLLCFFLLRRIGRYSGIIFGEEIFKIFTSEVKFNLFIWKWNYFRLIL